ncbi:MAG: hypothetical protein K2O15_00855 [Lachnospiraceae bacterium]|nr:hypothetical protein [Lachnospiraceae bacterium]
MNKILYEASYIGSPKCFSSHLIVTIWSIGFVMLLIYAVKRERKLRKDSSRYIGFAIAALIWGWSGFSDIGESVSEYREVILGYKEGNYREVEGIVEDYTEHKNNDTFTVNGIEFEVSGIVSTWGYTFRRNENVITGDGQHLKIRYIPNSSGSNCIVYIEEIVDE